MAGNIENVNLTKLNALTETFNSSGCEFAQSFGDMNRALEKMSPYWTGRRWNVVVDKWNQSLDMFFEAQSFYHNEIRNTLDQINKQYQAFHQGGAQNFGGGHQAVKDRQLKRTDDNSIRFIQTEIDKYLPEFDKRSSKMLIFTRKTKGSIS